MAQSKKGEIVCEFLELHPTKPHLTLAKMIVKQYPAIFKDVESVRTMIRAYVGKSGDHKRAQNLGGKKFYKDKDAPINFSPYKLPEPIDEDIKPYKLPLVCNNIGIISDLHIPNHRNAPIEVALDFFKEKKVNTIILNGDILDNTPFTRHGGKRPSSSDVRDWFDMAELFFQRLRESFPDISIYWLEGNHDNWYKRWMMEHAWQLDEDPYYDLTERLHIDEYKIRFVPQEQYVMAGKLSICHGHKLMGMWGSGVSPARTVFLKTKKSTLIGHVHVTDDYTDTNLHREITTCWATGCCCTLSPSYQPMGGKACHGFAWVTVEKGGRYSVKNYRVENGKIL
jgi:predicted phosphodiesterase